MIEEDEPRFQGADTDEFTAAAGVVYDQAAGEEMAIRIIELELKVAERERTIGAIAKAMSEWDGHDWIVAYRKLSFSIHAILNGKYTPT